jgi:eukaryotic-like serine/threonine-protein kinase
LESTVNDDTLDRGATGDRSVDVPAVGSTVLGKYRVERVIGQGGMGVVLAARNIQLDELVAFKFLSAKVATDGPTVDRFLREARASLKIKNEHVVRVLDASPGDATSPPYILMEYLEGIDLAALLQQRGPLPIADAVDYVLQACEAISEAHVIGIVHRDLKPANLLLTQRGDGMPLVKVLDFGISKALMDETSNPNLTDTQAVFGSPTYMSPEQVRSSKRVDHRTDVWAMAVVLYELLTGRTPFICDNVSGLLAAIIADSAPHPGQFRPDLPPELAQVLMAALQKDREQRTQTMPEFAARLRPFASAFGQHSCDAIARIALRPPNSGSSLIPAGDSGRFSAPLMFGATERSVVTSNKVGAPKPGGNKWLAVVVAAAVVCGIVGLGLVRVMAGRADATRDRTAAQAPSSQAAPPAFGVPSGAALGQSPPTLTAGSATSVVEHPVASGAKPVTAPGGRPLAPTSGPKGPAAPSSHTAPVPPPVVPPSPTPPAPHATSTTGTNLDSRY